MTSFQEEFDDSSATRCANGVSAINELNSYSNDSLEEQKENINGEENDMSSNATIMPTLTDGKIQQQNNKISHDSQDDDEARAFKSQFDEIKCVSRMFEYFKNNAYNRFQGRSSSQRRISETGMNSFHQRSQSHSVHTQQTNRQILKHQRSISSIQGLSFNGNPSAMKFYSAHGLPSTPFSSYGFDNTDDILSPSRHPWHHFDDSGSVNGNDDSLTKFRDLENSGRYGFNNSRFDEWDDSSSGYPSTPLSNGPYTPIPHTPTSYSSLSPSTPYFAQSHSFLDDEELFEKAKRLEEERRLLQIQQRKLDDAIAAHKLRYHHSDSSLNESEARCKSNNTTSPLISTRGKAISSLQIKPPFGNKLTSPRFQNSQEPIGTPIRKSGYITPPSTTPTGSSHSTLSASAPAFSLFSNSPALSLNNNLMNQQKKHHRNMSSDNNNFNLNGKISPFNGYPLTPSNSPPKTNDGYFGYTNANNNIWVNNNENNYFNTLTSTIFSTPTTGYFRAPLYSTPVDEREEDSLFADEYFSKKDYGSNFNTYSFDIGNRYWVD